MFITFMIGVARCVCGSCVNLLRMLVLVPPTSWQLVCRLLQQRALQLLQLQRNVMRISLGLASDIIPPPSSLLNATRSSSSSSSCCRRQVGRSPTTESASYNCRSLLSTGFISHRYAPPAMTLVTSINEVS